MSLFETISSRQGEQVVVERGRGDTQATPSEQELNLTADRERWDVGFDADIRAMRDSVHTEDTHERTVLDAVEKGGGRLREVAPDNGGVLELGPKGRAKGGGDNGGSSSLSTVADLFELDQAFESGCEGFLGVVSPTERVVNEHTEILPHVLRQERDTT